MPIPTFYLGETDAKRVAREQLYQRVLELQPTEVRKKGWTVVLAGPEAGEAGCLRYLLGVKPEKVLFVDTDGSGLKMAKHRWAGVETYRGDVLAALRYLKEPCSFINLDFTGMLRDHEREVLEEASSMLLPEGIISYTYFNGRENSGCRCKQEFMKIPAVRERLPMTGANKSLVFDEKRTVWYAGTIQGLLGAAYEPVFLLRYTARHPTRKTRKSTMSMLGYQNMPKNLRTPAWHRKVERSALEGASTGTFEILNEERVRSKAIALYYEGKRSKEVSEILNLSPTKVAAWIAHETRGTYSKNNGARRHKE